MNLPRRVEVNQHGFFVFKEMIKICIGQFKHWVNWST